jgi:hypothetical protein
MDTAFASLRLAPDLIEARLRANLGALVRLDDERLRVVATRGADAGWTPWTGSAPAAPVRAVRVRFTIDQLPSSFDVALELLPGIAFPYRSPLVVVTSGAESVDRATVMTATAAWDPRTSTLATFLTVLADGHAAASVVASFTRAHADPRTSLRGDRRSGGRHAAGGARRLAAARAARRG